MSQNNQENAPVTGNGRGSKNIISWVIVGVLSVCCVYLIVSRNRLISDNNIALKQKQQIIDSVKTDRTYLQADFDAASAKIDELMSKNTGLKDSVQDYKTAITGLRAQIKTILGNQKATQEDLMTARGMIYMLNIKTQAYALYMAELERDNAILTGEHKLLTEERDQTVAANIALKMVGSVLHASNMRMQLIHERRNGKEKETDKAKKVNKIRITFDIDENRIAESGTRQIYIRIVAPGNKVLYTADVSGTMNTIEGDQIKYSVLKEIDLVKSQPLKNVEIDWMQNDIYSKGVYKIELYDKGYKIGEGSVKLI